MSNIIKLNDDIIIFDPKFHKFFF